MIWWYALALALWGGVGYTSATPRAAFGQVNHTAGYQMSRKSCIASGVRGSCMWVQDCNRSGGKHAGVCVDGFMFGSCCMLPDINESGGQRKPSATLTENPYQMPSIENLSNQPQVDVIIKPNPTQRPSFMTKPLDGGTLNYRPPQLSLPLLSGSVDIKEQSNLSSNTYVNKYDDGVDTSHKVSSSPQRGTARPIPTNTLQDNEVDDSINSVHRLRPNINMNSIWQGTTEPTFITKSRPANWEKPEKPNRPKPTKKFTTTTSKSVTWKPYQKPTSKPIKPVKIPQIPDDGTTTNRVTQADVNEMTESSVLFTTSVATTVECGVATLAHRPETRIVGGKDATFGKWPWQVSVRRTSFLGFSSTHRCGGAILSEGWIATAGHCVDDLLTSQIRIRVGEYDFSSDDEKYPYVERGVSKKAVHPKYNFFTYEYDLALVKLESDLVFSPHIAPICLPASDDSLVGRNATVTGWGRLAEGGTLPSVLQEVQVPIVSNERCKSMFLRAGRKEYIPDIFLCAGHERGGHDSCQGDSGGPLQVKGRDHRYFLAGIISWGIGCAEANLPGVCTRISKFVPWILKTVSENTTISTPPAAS